MEDYKYLKELENVKQGNEFIEYIINRVLSSDYRGFQCSQHNRLTYSYFMNVIMSIYKFAGDKIFDIHIGDDLGVRQGNASCYYDIVNEIKKITGKGTINSIKKNTFPDIARMGFLNRYNKSGDLISENGSRSCIYKVGLSNLGIEYAEKDNYTKLKLFTDGIDYLTKNLASELVELFYTNDYDIDKLDLKEFMYIISDDRSQISVTDKLRILREYRKLTFIEKTKIDKCLKDYCNPNNRKCFSNKTLLRDYSNWKNESQQIYCLLANSRYFKINGNDLVLNTYNNGLFYEQPKRGEKAKKDYFEKHRIKRRDGYELHHIIPFSKALNKKDVIYIDDYKNLIYLSSEKHKEFTKLNNNNIKLKYDINNPNMLFLSFDESYIIVNIDQDALISKELLIDVKNYNNKLLEKFYYV